MSHRRKKPDQYLLALQSVLNKIAVYKFFSNLTARFSKMSFIKISVQSGRAENNFNRAFNTNENIRLSTLLRYWRAIQQLIHDGELTLGDEDKPLTFESLIDDELTEILDMVNKINEMRLEEEVEDRDFQHFLRGLEVYATSLSKRGLLLQEEANAFYSLIEKVKMQGGK